MRLLSPDVGCHAGPVGEYSRGSRSGGPLGRYGGLRCPIEEETHHLRPVPDGGRPHKFKGVCTSSQSMSNSHQLAMIKMLTIYFLYLSHCC